MSLRCSEVKKLLPCPLERLPAGGVAWGQRHRDDNDVARYDRSLSSSQRLCSGAAIRWAARRVGAPACHGSRRLWQRASAGATSTSLAQAPRSTSEHPFRRTPAESLADGGSDPICQRLADLPSMRGPATMVRIVERPGRGFQISSEFMHEPTELRSLKAISGSIAWRPPAWLDSKFRPGRWVTQWPAFARPAEWGSLHGTTPACASRHRRGASAHRLRLRPEPSLFS